MKIETIATVTKVQTKKTHITKTGEKKTYSYPQGAVVVRGKQLLPLVKKRVHVSCEEIPKEVEPK